MPEKFFLRVGGGGGVSLDLVRHLTKTKLCRFREHFNKLLFCCRFEETPDQVRIRRRREAGRQSLSQSLSSLLVVVFTLLVGDVPL